MKCRTTREYRISDARRGGRANNITQIVVVADEPGARVIRNAMQSPVNAMRSAPSVTGLRFTINALRRF